jgi:hypothetical protein
MRVKYHRGEFWELSTVMNYESEEPPQILRVKYRNELWEWSTAKCYEG